MFSKCIQATFEARPNRFVAHCRLRGKTVHAYLPNPGRMWELLLPGVTLWLEPTPKPDAKLPYTVAAVERDSVPVMLHTHRTNDVAEKLLKAGSVPGLEKAEILKREAVHGRSRFDFLLNQGGEKIFLEVKSCTLFSRRMAMFPDAVTARGRKHLEELANLQEPHTRGAVLFIVHNPRVDYFLPEYHTDLDFSQTFLSLRHRLEMKALAVAWDAALNFKVQPKLLTIPWDILKRECHDQGAYLIILKLGKAKTITIGSLGLQQFPAGYYVYVGSARKALTPRVARHRRILKKMHWHLDYLRPHTEWVADLPVRTQDDLECALAQAQTKLADWAIPGFGCSDCGCASHLFGFQGNPLEQAEFHAMLQDFRMDRLVKA